MRDLGNIIVRDQRQPGWFYVDNEILDRYAGQIGAYGLAVYCVISRHSKNQVAKLSQRDIAASLGISHDRVGKSFRTLGDLDLIFVEVPERPGPGLISEITLLNVKLTGRHTSSSVAELDATRPLNKEEKPKLINPPSPLAGGLFDHSPAPAPTSRDRRFFFQELNRIYAAAEGAPISEEAAIERACERTGTPYEFATEWVALTYREKVG